jgi:hypothetical protein
LKGYEALHEAEVMHIHEWSRLSSHPTSEGQVVYTRCACGAHGVELVPRDRLPRRRTLAVVDEPLGQRSGEIW